MLKAQWLVLATAIAFIPPICAGAQDIPPATSLVYPGINGKLIYVPDSLGNKIPDFSNAGYMGGGVPIPYVPVKKTLWPVLGDNSVAIQQAIDEVSSLPMDAGGFRGAILLKMGIYPLDKPIYIKESGVVIRGEGMGDTGTILFGRITPETRGPAIRRPALVNVAGGLGVEVVESSRQNIADSYVPVGARTFNIKSTKGLKLGDRVLIARIGNQEWIRAIGQDTVAVGRNRWKPFDITYDRTIVDIKGNAITIDAPVFTAIEAVWGGGHVTKYNERRIEQVGIENLRTVSEFDPSIRTKAYGNMDRESFDDPAIRYEGEEYFSDENHYFNSISFTNAMNAWVRNVSALHFAGSMVLSNAGTKWITVQDCESKEPVSVRQGGRRFTFQMNGQFCLVQRCVSQKGRHSFVLQGPQSSGNVFLNCEAINPYSTSEPHNRWVNGVLYDNVRAPLTARFWDYIIGWAGANIVFWNCEGDFLIQQPPTAQNFSFGHIGINAVIFNAPLQDLTKPRGYIESLDKHVTPRSLYLAQLKDRLGDEAVKNVTQKALDN